MVNNVSSVEEMLEREILEIIYCSYCWVKSMLKSLKIIVISLKLDEICVKSVLFFY
jgi:hypothetical protein